MHVFHSCSQEDPSSDHQMVSCSPPNPGFWDDFSPPVRGLICCHNDGKVMVGNPSTCQFVTLPRVNSSKKIIFPFIGYDPVNDVYKVLCMRVACNYRGGPGGVLSKGHLVFTLGGKKKWKNIECEHYHWIRARNQGICSNGVVYYLACINKISPSLICFDLASEKFSVMELPGDVELLVNYSEKIAITNMLSDGTLDLWILEDASKQEWSKVSILVPSWTNLFMSHDRFMFRGTLGTGELIFAPWINPNPFYLLCYDLKENKARKIWIEGVGIQDSYVEVFLNHVENPMFLPKIRY